MSAAAFDTFLETLREPSQPTLSPKRMADALHMGVSELAGLARVHRNTVTGNPESAQLQSAMRDIVKVLAAASRVNEDRERTLFWFRNHPITEYDYQTAAELVQKGKVEAVLLYLATLEAGATG
jgi:hypothetical protein